MSSLTLITPVILAAGDSVRMGYPKAILPLGPDCFLTRILHSCQAAGLGKPTVVLGKSATEIRSKIDIRQADTLVNSAPERGQFSSLQLALAALKPECVAAMVWPVDQPFVSAELVRELAQLFLSSGDLIACPLYRDKRGHPAIFRRELFHEFIEAPLEEGPKKIVLRNRDRMALLSTDEAATVHDIDTPDDYEAACGESLDSALHKIRSM